MNQGLQWFYDLPRAVYDDTLKHPDPRPNTSGGARTINLDETALKFEQA
jgi:hypothetical protein